MIVLMKLAKNNYEILKDAFSYAVKSWLRSDLAEGSENEAIMMHACATFLLDNLFIKEKAGETITKLAAEDIGSTFEAKKLGEKAKEMYALLEGDEFAKGRSPLRDYVAWIAEEKEEVLEAFKDKAGRLALVYIDQLVTLMAVEHPEIEKLRIAEILFLNMVDAFAQCLKASLREKYLKLASLPFFQDVTEEFERIRAEIDD